MYDNYDFSAYDRLLDIQNKVQSKYGKSSIMYDLMDTVQDYWAEQDEPPPNVAATATPHQVSEAVSDMVHHIVKQDRKAQ